MYRYKVCKWYSDRWHRCNSAFYQSNTGVMYNIISIMVNLNECIVDQVIALHVDSNMVLDIACSLKKSPIT